MPAMLFPNLAMPAIQYARVIYCATPVAFSSGAAETKAAT